MDTYKAIIDTQVEEVFILTEDKSMYVIPIDKIKNKATINKCDKYQKCKVDM